MMRLPIVSRDRYDEMRDMLTARIEEVQELNRKLEDRLYELLSGRPLHAAARPPAPAPELQELSQVERAARRAGSRRPRAILQEIERENMEAFAAEHSLSDPAADEAARRLLDETEREGRAAARRQVTQ